MKIIIEDTPNPNAKIFFFDCKIKENESINFSKKDTTTIPLVQELFKIEGIENLYLAENFITVTKNDYTSWKIVTNNIKKILEQILKAHDPKFKVTETLKEFKDHIKKDILKINVILDKYIRPALKADGGDIDLIDLENNLLTIEYKGACGTCPSSTYGTLMAIENILRKEFNSTLEIKVSGVDDVDNRENGFFF